MYPEFRIQIQWPILRRRPLFTGVFDVMMFIEEESVLKEAIKVGILERSFEDLPHEKLGRHNSPLCGRLQAGGGWIFKFNGHGQCCRSPDISTYRIRVIHWGTHLEN